MYAAAPNEYATLPERQGTLRALGLALLVHALLVAALTWGVSWRRGDTSLAVEAELWSALPQEAAPKLAEPEPEPQPAPPPPAPPKAQAPQPSAAEIALARERERKAQEQAEQDQREKLAREAEERKKKLAEEKKKKEQEAKHKEQEAAKLRENLRQENMKRLAGLASSSNGSGTAQKASGPSSSYAGRIRARIKPNIVFLDELPGNPSAEVEVRTAPDGTIVGRKLLKSSGAPSWDEAVLKAIDKTETLPRDTDGTVHPHLVITFRPKD